jgi:alpha-galactosidase/6-phospho-beta-glucosidase family protein
LALVQHVAAYERLAASAAASGDRAGARLALMTHPLVRDHALAEAMLDPLLSAGDPSLPPRIGVGR